MMNNRLHKEKNIILNGLSAMPGGFFIYRGGDNDEILYVNSALLKIFECETEKEFMELTGGTFTGMVHKDDYSKVKKSKNIQIETDSDQFEKVRYRIVTNNGNIKYIEDFGRYYKDDDEGPLFYVFLSEIQLMKDPLTSLSTRWGFFIKSEKFIKDIANVMDSPVILALDLSGMKGFNARYGTREGDKFLCMFADLLRKFFGDNCARFGEDHFFAIAPHEGIEGKLDSFIQELCEINNGITLPVKIGMCICHEGMSVHLACDYARMACEAQKVQYGSGYGSFDEKMGQHYARAEYILSHLDQALNEGWIHVYLQPVIRGLSGRVCGFEALARWIDPIYGFITPGDFVPLLEENGLSYKLDIFMVKRVVELQGRNLKVGNPVVPVSVNISRSDFDYCDPVDIIINTLEEHNVRKDLICVEITETTLMNDKGLIKKEIKRLHEAGIEIWMDDFGSGYSSLNVLKDFEFDEIKIDMQFMRDFSEKSKTIITMAVKMAKELGIHTLAEGVETKEHLEFLKSIGCEKIQGYYYSKPLPVSDIRRYLSDHGLIMETREARSVYEKTGLIDVVQDKALALFFYDRTNFNLLFFNKKNRDYIGGDKELAASKIETDINAEGTFVYRKFRELAEKCINSHQEEMTVFVSGKMYFELTFKVIADSRQGYMILASIDDRKYEESKQLEMHDYIMRNVISSYDCIYYLDYTEDTRTVIYTNLYNEQVGSVTKGIEDFYKNYRQRYIHPDDMDRWKTFTDIERYTDPSSQNKDRIIRNIFRVKNPNGNYVWTKFMVVFISGGKDKKAIVCVRPSTIEQDVKVYGEFKDKTLNSSEITGDELMDAIRLNSEICFFWKDKDRRFVGVSDAFLKFYGFDSADAVLGKNDEEVGWHIDDTPFMTDEERVLLKGEIIRNSIGQNVIDGVTHYIAATKFPVYNNGEIVGLMGYFIDINQDVMSDTSLRDQSQRDHVTGLMNSYGHMVTLSQLGDNLRTNGEDFTYVLLDIPEFENIREDYGRDIAEKFIKVIAKYIVFSFGRVTSVFRLYGCCFAVCKRNTSKEDIIRRVELWKKYVSSIREIESREIRVHGEYGIINGSECYDMQDVYEGAKNDLNRRMKGDNENNTGLLDIGGYYESLPLPYFVAKPVLSEDNKTPVDLEYIYVNGKYCDATGKKASELIGHCYTGIFSDLRSSNWISVGYRASMGEYIHDRSYSFAFKRWVNYIAAPASHAGTFSIVIVDYNDENQPKEKMISVQEPKEAVNNMELYDHSTKTEKGGGYKNDKIDDISFRIAKILSGDDEYEKAMNAVINILKENLEIDRLYIMECTDDGISNTFEWCAPNVRPVISKWQNVELKTYVTDYEVFKPGQCIVINDLEKYKYVNPSRALNMISQGIRNVVEAPFFNDGKLLGFIGIDNYKGDEEYVKKLLENTSYFIGFKVHNNALHRKNKALYLAKALNKDEAKKEQEEQNVTGYDNGYYIPDPNTDLPVDYIIGKIILDSTNLHPLDFEFLYVNDKFSRKVGKNRDEIMGRKFRDTFFNADPTWVTDGYQAALHGKTLTGRKYSVLGKTWVDYRMVPGSEEGTFILILMDISESYNKEIEMERENKKNECLVEIAGILASQESHRVVIDDALKTLAKFFYASRVYIVMKDGEETKTEFQYCSKGVKPNDYNFSDIDKDFIEHCTENLREYENIIRFDVESIRETYPEIYDKLRYLNVRNMIGMPFYRGDDITGFLCIENYEMSRIDDTGDFIRTASELIFFRLNLLLK
ncbi:EAL domain-containing protein [Oribacterium sp. FC2011]|uniref:EAL domain-containing protein n=1 Tax=Oribacterium sp. FC2011 TaxID=1408311 RepID=UPI000678A06C|nr:EAL domain-containing protein [Oribacterium sp. FC2011]